MNLWVLDEDPIAAAQRLDDKRIGSALMEATMMLSVAVKNHGEIGPGKLCKPSHQNHPVTLWVGANHSNWQWCLIHAYALDYEFSYRFDNRHQAALRLDYIKQFDDCLLPGDLLPFQNSARNQALDLDFSHLPVPLSYRAYLQERWKTDKRAVTFKNRGFPQWSQT